MVTHATSPSAEDKALKDTAQSSPTQDTILLLQLPRCTCQMDRNKGKFSSKWYHQLCKQHQDRVTSPSAAMGAQLDGARWFLPLGPATTTSRGATPALLVSTVKDWGILARTAVPRPGPAIFTLLGSTTSFTGTLKGLPGSECSKC